MNRFQHSGMNHDVIRLGWIFVMSAGIYVKPYLAIGLNWVCSHPTLWTPQFGYLPLLVISVGGMVWMAKKFQK